MRSWWRFAALAGLLAAVASQAQPPLTDTIDVKVSAGGSDVEDHITASPLNPKLLMVSNIRDASGVVTWVSQDAGQTWRKFGTPITGSVDPIAAISPHVGDIGRFLVSHLQGHVDVNYKNTLDSLTAWSNAVVEPVGTSGWDKNYLWVDPRAVGTHAKQVYCAYSDAEPLGDPDAPLQRVYARASGNHGVTWGTRSTIEAGAGVTDRNYLGISIATAPDVDRVYATWASREDNAHQRAKGIMFRYSTDGGVSWTAPTGGPTIMELQGFSRHNTISGNNGLVGKDMRATVSPSMVVAGDGDVYIVFTDREPGHSDTDIYILKSDDRGVTWKMPGGSTTGYKRVNSGGAGVANQDQWFPWISWDECKNALVVVYYDSRDNTADVNAYTSVSFNEGVDWTDLRVSDVSWDGDAPMSPFGDTWAGDYIGVAARDGVAYPVWSDDRVTADSYRVYTSPIELWSGVIQASVSASYVANDQLKLDVTGAWGTDCSSDGTDHIVVTSPSGVQYLAAATPGTLTTTHSVTRADCACETGNWNYVVKSTKAGFLPKASSAKTFRVYNCLD